MDSIYSHFSFFKAGQGAFYGGHIWNATKKSCFTVVYDCGTSGFVKGNSQSLNSEIDLFKKEYFYRYDCSNPKKIDLLFISHLDYDHVSGIKRLLNEFEVKRIILPYVDPINRPYFLTSFDSDQNNTELNGLTLDDYSLFLQEPVAFIHRQEGSQEVEVSFIKGENNPDNPDNPDNRNLFFGKSEGIFESKKAVNDKDEFFEMSNVNVYENNLQIQLYSYWDFMIYVQDIELKQLEGLINGIRSILAISDEATLTTDNIKKLFENDESRRLLRKCYKDNVDDINSHGLVLLHGPINIDRLYSRDFISYYYLHSHKKYWEYVCSTELYTLLLGDTSLNPMNNQLKFPLQFLSRLAHVNVVQIPHHGSIKNWDKKTYEDLKLGSNNCCKEVIAVCNYGVGNTYNHPSQEVINEVNGTLVLNNQYTRFTTCYEFTIKSN